MLSEGQLQVVHALQEAPRASWAALSSTLKVDPRTIARTFTRLVESGTLRLMATPGPRLLNSLQFAQLRLRAAPGQAPLLAAHLAQWPQATTVRVSDGSFDVHALVIGADHRALLRAVHNTVAVLPAVEAAELNTALCTIDVGRAGRLDSLSREQVNVLRAIRPASHDRTPVRLTAGDFEIMQVLGIDGRMETGELARRLDREPSTVSQRLRRLYADGYLDFVAITVDSASSYPVIALLWCTADPTEWDALIRQLPAKPWLGSFTLTSGASNMCITAQLQVPAALSRIVKQLAAISPSLNVTETQISSHAVKLHTCWLDSNDRFTNVVSDPYAALAKQIGAT
ncbi:Lrp/AsnC family transcriptional regulator [Streptomyces sp. NPDC048419]|uniref:Lrp/AsnC family transcriptional regulator n=1 Tax=Streptomyces sp. NPDC048419 TaxID=3365547 RepID=UPI003720E40A